MQVAFGRVHRKTEPTGPGSETVVISKIDTYGTPQNRTYQSPAGLETPPVEDGNCGLFLQTADVAGDEEECEVVYDRMDLFTASRY